MKKFAALTGALLCAAAVAACTTDTPTAPTLPTSPLGARPITHGTPTPTFNMTQLSAARSRIWAARASLTHMGFTIDKLSDIDVRTDGRQGLVVYGQFITSNARTNPSPIVKAITSLATVPVLVDGATDPAQRPVPATGWVAVPTATARGASTPVPSVSRG